jgi:opacity protein-like surface antigen
MKKHIYVAVVAVMALAAAAVFAQAPKGWLVRSDHSMNASDPDAAGSIKFVTMDGGFHATNPMAAVYWNPANTVTGNYTLKGKFTLIKMGGFNEYYGLIFGGSDLNAAGQSYLYFMVSDDGTFLIKRRTGSSTQGVSQKTENAAVKKPDSTGKCTNDLEVRVKPDKIDFVINGAVVSSLPRTGPTAKTDGIYGIRVNHHLEVQIDGFGISKM